MLYSNEDNKDIKNFVNHPLILFAREDLIKDRLERAHAKPGAKPKAIIPQEYPLNVSSYGLPEAIDDKQMIGNHQECRPTIPPLPEWADVMVVSLKYWLGITKAMLVNNGNNIHPLFSDRLWIAEPVYAPGSEGKKPVIGSYLEKAIRSLRPDVYVNFLRNDPNVAPSLMAVKATLDCYPENRPPDAMTPYVQELRRWYDEQIQRTAFHTTPPTFTFQA